MCARMFRCPGCQTSVRAHKMLRTEHEWNAGPTSHSSHWVQSQYVDISDSRKRRAKYFPRHSLTCSYRCWTLGSLVVLLLNVCLLVSTIGVPIVNHLALYFSLVCKTFLSVCRTWLSGIRLTLSTQKLRDPRWFCSHASTSSTHHHQKKNTINQGGAPDDDIDMEFDYFEMVRV